MKEQIIITLDEPMTVKQLYQRLEIAIAHRRDMIAMWEYRMADKGYYGSRSLMQEQVQKHEKVIDELTNIVTVLRGAK